MNLKLHSKSDPSSPTVVALFEGGEPHRGPLGKNKHELIETLIKRKAFKGEAGQTFSGQYISTSKVQRIMLYGLGKEGDWDATQARNYGSKLVRAAASFGEKTVSIVIPPEAQKHLQALAEGIGLGNYDSAIHKTSEEHQKKQEKRVQTVYLLCKSWTKIQENTVKKGKLISEVVNYTRNIVNCGPRQMSISQFATEVKTVAKRNGYKLTDLNKRQLEKMKMGGLLAVNRGSEEPAHMLILEHNAKMKEEPIVIAGKGIIFDTGGVSLKPSTHMHEMQLDMGGAAVVLAIFKLLKKLDIKRRVIGIMPVTDNAVGNKAYRPSEIITTYSGQTVEIMNTDAEGRMILSDALYYGATKYNPRYMIDLATLTGACMVALGYRNAGLFGNDEDLIGLIKDAGKRSDESVCHLPITDADTKAMKGKLADLTNLDMTGRYAGAPRAAAFLKNFVADSKWAHLDIAGPAFTKEPKDYEIPMGTGFGVRLMIDFLENL